MFYKREWGFHKIVVVMIVVFMVSLVGCKKTIKPDLLGSGKIDSEKTTEEPLEELEIAKVEKDFPEEERIEIGDVQEIPDLKAVYFEFDKADLTSQALQTLSENAQWLRKNNEVKIIIEGHCDERGTVEYNLSLGQKRATSVRNYLITLGIEADRISTISYGEEKPINLQHNEEAWAQNRRANTVGIIED